MGDEVDDEIPTITPTTTYNPMTQATIPKYTCTTNKSDIKSVNIIESFAIDSSGDKTAAFDRVSWMVANGKDDFDDDDVMVTTSGNLSCKIWICDYDRPPRLIANNNDIDISDNDDEVFNSVWMIWSCLIWTGEYWMKRWRNWIMCSEQGRKV